MARLDDETISDDVYLLRVLRAKGWWNREGDKVGATSLAFFDGFSGETSCHIDVPFSRSLSAKRFPGCYLARFTAGQARNHGFNVTLDPLGDPEGSDTHVVLTFAIDGARRKVYQAACRQLARESEVIDPPDAECGSLA